MKLIPTGENFSLLFVIILTLLFSWQLSAQQNEISHSVYFTANSGMEKADHAKRILQQINEASQADDSASVVILGNITPKGGYPPDDKARKQTEDFIKNSLLEPLEGFNGNIILNPGKNEWNKEGHQNIDDLESFLQDNSKAEFWPNDGCGLEREDLNDNITVVMVDSQWFLEDWDDHPYINDKCEIKTREQFFVEFKDELKDEQGKTIIVAVHHPVMSNTRLGFFNKIGGFSKQSYQNPMHRQLRSRLKTLSRQFEDVIFVSGNDRNLQYIYDDETPQIISGSAGKIQKAKAEKEQDFAANVPGFTKMNFYKNGSTVVDFYEASENGPVLLKSKYIRQERISEEEVSYHSKDEFEKTISASIYSEEEADKSIPYQKMWGEHYRDIYSREIEVPVLFIDTLPGHPKAINEGGGRQSRSLRIRDDNENEFTLREIRKSALRFIQAQIPGHYVHDFLENTVAEKIVQDFYTTAHPYAPFAVNDIMEDLEILHANPKLYYVPKQKNLGIYNEDYGDKLYMLEEHVGDHNKEFKDFGDADDILSTADLLLELRETKKVKVDESAYLRARLADMLIGDWDRHGDQWRWAEYEQDNDEKIYKPIPRDRDQAFSKYDGLMVRLLQYGVPPMRAMQTFDTDLKEVKWFNTAAYPLDKAFIRNAKWKDWQDQIEFIQQNLTDEKIDAAFANLPEDVQDESIEEIKIKLKGRRDNLEEIARNYYGYFSDFEVITGTAEDDSFEISRKPDGETEIKISGGDDTEFSKTYAAEETKEIWIYGLDGEDEFKIEGEGSNLIKLKIIGGENNDTYDFKNSRNTKIYDYKSKKNSFKKTGSKILTDNYDINNYDPDKRKYTTNIFYPSIGFDPDAGMKVGVKNTFTTFGLARNPFTAKHSLALNYHFATNGFSAAYVGEFAHIFPNWNLGIDAGYNSPNYTMNFFGSGNGTTYNEDIVGMDFNRVRIGEWSFAPSLIHRNNRGSTFSLQAKISSFEVAFDENQFIGQEFSEENEVFNSQLYAGGEVSYRYFNQDNPAFPSRGFDFEIKTGYKSNIDEHDNQFTYLMPSLAINYPLHPSGIAVFATKLGCEMIFGDNYEFYHGATLGGNYDLRGFRNERFNGKTSFFHSSDIRVGLSQIRTNYIPLRIGISGGFDYGRVWSPDDHNENWYSNYGGSFFINGFNALTANLGYYLNEDGNRFMFSLGFNF